MNKPISFVPIRNINDRFLLPWLDLYETAFPPHEKILVSSILRILRNKRQSEEEGMNIVAILDGKDKFIGMAMYQLPPDKLVGVLWYIAVIPDQQNKGWGSNIYNGVLAKINPKTHKALVFEVEIPGETNSSPDAERRIHFYQKNGAKLLTGIYYLQSVGWHQPPTPMHIMIHPILPMNVETAYDLAHTIFEDTLQKIGPLALE